MAWYEWAQNNSGGFFEEEKNGVCHRLFIEADTYDLAEQKVFELGVYYDGVDEGYDCECCGDRWYSGNEVTEESVEKYAQKLATKYGWTSPDARLFYKDGTIMEIFGSKRSRARKRP